ncbi:MAG: thioredoxin [Muribaculaceae bacterium]|jgi:thioredoxin 1|nr:thioredoxin [Muribaculaceae bacterium]MBO7165352.1 thioredoxin [Muribaculaceae bacterium]MBQ1184840.1 thioredoxin [Muribaculaceae bacterium]MBQ1268111.1 thioredoxin [Muribaculaceae bacterium]MBQ2370465.1 thioredoxin [Muribaculaceae bacterium]
MAVQFTDQTAKEAIESGKVVVIDFWAEWCGPCVKLGPAVEAVAEKYEGKAIVGKMNVDENDEVSSENRVRNIPTILFFKDGELKDRTVGLVSQADIEAKLEALL